MLSYFSQYNISNGIFITYDSQLKKRLLHTRHKQKTIDGYKSRFPHMKWETRTKETFVLGCVYIIFKKTPSSYAAFVSELRELDIKELASFKYKIMNYRIFMKKDIEFLKENFGSSISNEAVLNSFLKNDIEFYTAWWFIHFKGDVVNLGRTYTHVLRKLNFIMLFLTFKEESIKDIKELLNQIEL